VLGKYEKRHFHNEEKVWVGTYRNLTNILHWHMECELIRIAKGSAQIKIGNSLFSAVEGDCLFCSAEEPHYIIASADTVIEIMIFHKELLGSITDNYKPKSPLLSNPAAMMAGFVDIRRIISQKPRFYRATLQNCAEKILLSVFHQNEICPRQSKKLADKRIIDKIHRDFATVTFAEMVTFSGYGASHFSKLFKRITGMTFSDYLNYVKVEHAISLLQNEPGLTIADISLRCGFATIRNFNRVFKQITGFTPSSLPSNFITNLNIGAFGEDGFNPTSGASILL
jgi:AraC-like DNA-binding protein